MLPLCKLGKNVTVFLYIEIIIVVVVVVIGCVLFIGSMKRSVQVGIPTWFIFTTVTCHQLHLNITPVSGWHLNYCDDYPTSKPSFLGLPVDCIWPLVKKYVHLQLVDKIVIFYISEHTEKN
jgi:hypothetical protein